MSWNMRTKVVALGIAIQTVAGTFVAPAQADLVAVASPTNDISSIVATDSTATGAIFDSPDIFLGITGTAGGTIPLRGHGLAVPPAASAFVPGRILQAAGWTENRLAAAVTGTAAASPSPNSIRLATGSSTVNDLYLGAAIQHPSLGTSGTRQYTQIIDYDGTTFNALTAEPIGTTIASGTYTIPAQLYYVLGTQTTAPPLLSISVWRDKKRYDYVDCRPTQLVIDIPVANEANQVFPSMQFTCKGNILAIADDVTPTLPAGTLNNSVPPARGGKFYLDRTQLGHQDLKYTQGGTVAAASNQNKDAGQDGYDILGATRAIDLDLNQMNVTDFDIQTRLNNQTVLPVLSIWGTNVGNRWAFTVPNIVLRPFSPGDRNGYVNLTGTAQTTDVDKSIALALF